jgi:uncharacterized membrane protein YbaN (DUF454 family)
MGKKLTLVRIILGVLFLFLGVIGLFLPVLQGVLFLIIGAGLLGYPISARWLKKIGMKKKSSH